MHTPAIDWDTQSYPEIREFDQLGPMRTQHLLLKFDRSYQHQIDDRWEESIVAQRLGATGLATGGLLGLLATAFGYLKMNALTSGRYRGRLRLAAVGAIVGLGVMGFATLRWIAIII